MDDIRQRQQILTAAPTIEGAGVRLKRLFGFNEVPRLDPFLLFDHFGSRDPQDYMAGFPWHPHRGIETVTYMIQGSVEHGDSIGNSGIIHAGDVQWMTAGSGIIHQEMPQESLDSLIGFQLWVNLPQSHKMMEPRYREVKADTIPTVRSGDASSVKVIAGSFGDTKGPVGDLSINCTYLDVSIPAGITWTYPTKSSDTVIVYIFDGSAYLDLSDSRSFGIHTGIHYGSGERIRIRTETNSVRFLLMTGPPLNEPIAWRGPIVMNTDEELQLAFREFHEGTFIKK
jgi:redox-sensitive bicupin YhaK (pirin superfamily)